jgi:hypothetical protein
MKLLITFLFLTALCSISVVSGTQYTPPWAQNYDFTYPDLDTTPAASVSASQQSQMSYNGTYFTNSGAQYS